jgi:hypothetical protein
MACKYIYKGITFNSEEEFQKYYSEEGLSPTSSFQKVFTEEDIEPIDSTQEKISFFQRKFKDAGLEVRVELDDSISERGLVEVIDGIPTIKLNPNKITGDTVSHEFAHIFIDLLGYEHPTVQSAIKALKETQLYNDVRTAYPELWNNQEALDKEVLATALGKDAASYYSQLNNSKQKIWINRVWDALVRYFERLYNKAIGRDAIKELVRSFVDDKIVILNEVSLSPYTQRQKDNVDSLIEDSKRFKGKDDKGYTIEGIDKVLDRVTNFISKFKRPFDADRAALVASAGKKEKYKGRDVEDIKAEWTWKTNAGTSVHTIAEYVFNSPLDRTIEDIVNSLRIKGTPEEKVRKKSAATKLVTQLKEFQRVRNISSGSRFFSEVVVFDEELGLAGTIDLIEVMEDGTVNILDFKTKETGEFDENEFEKPKGYGFYGEMRNVPDSKKNEYAMQLSTYKLILERRGIKVKDLIIVPIEADLKRETVDGQRRFRYENPTIYQRDGKVKLFELDDLTEELSKELQITVEEEDVPTINRFENRSFQTKGMGRFKQEFDNLRGKIMKTVTKDRKITEGKTIEALIGRLKTLLEQRKKLYEGREASLATDFKQINELIKVLDAKDSLDTLVKLRSFALGEPNNAEFFSMGELDKIRAYLQEREVIMRYDDNGKPIRERLVRRNNYWFYQNALGTLQFYKELMELPIDFLTEDVSKRRQIEQEIALMKKEIGGIISELEDAVRRSFHVDVLPLILDSTTDPKLMELLNDEKLVDGVRVPKTEEELAQDYKTITDIVFGVQADLTQQQFWLSWAGQSNDKFIALTVAKLEIELNKAQANAGRKKVELKNLIDKFTDISFLFEKTDAGVMTRRFLQPYKFGWIEEYTRLKTLVDTAEEQPSFDRAYNMAHYSHWVFTNTELTQEGKDAIKEWREKKRESSNKDEDFKKGYIAAMEELEGASFPFPRPEYFKRNKLGGFIPTVKWKNASKAWAEIQNDADKKALYDSIQELMGYSMQYVKNKDRYAAAFGFLPSVLIEQPKGFWNTIKGALPDKETFKEKAETVGVDEYGSIAHMIPFYYVTKDIREVSEEEIPFTKDNFERALMLFTDAAYEYRMKSEVEPIMLLALSERKNAEYFRGKVTGESKRTLRGRQQGEVFKFSGEDALAVKQMESYFLNVLYGKDKNLDDNENLNKISNFIMNHMSITTLALNWRAGVADLVTGQLGAFMEANSGRHFTKKDWGWAMKKTTDFKLMYEYGKSDGPLYPSKDAAILHQFYVLQDTKEMVGSKGSKLKAQDLTSKALRGAKKYGFMFENAAEWHGQNAVLFAMMKAEKLTDKDGNVVSLYDALDFKDGTVSLKEGYTTKKGVTLKKDDVDNYLADFRRRTLHMNHNLQGRYTKEHQAEVQRYWWGRMLIQFRKHMWSAWRDRFGSRGSLISGSDEFWDESTAERDKGRYFTYGFMLKQVFREAIRGNMYVMRDLFLGKNLSPEDWQDIKKTNMELLILGSIALLVFGLTSLKDDDEEESLAFNIALNLTDRIYTNLGSFFPITTEYKEIGIVPEFIKTVKSPAASLSMVNNYYKFLGQVMPWNWAEEFEGGPYREASKLRVESMKLLPITKELLSLEFLEQNANYYRR